MSHNSNTPVESDPTQSDGYLAEARVCFDRHDLPGAVKLLDLIFASDHCPEGSFYLKSLCYDQPKQSLEALQAAEAELILNPTHPGAIERCAKLYEGTSFPGSETPSTRPWSTALDQNLVRHFEHCSHRYRYRSVPMSKNAFDLALYPMLLWQIKPRTIIEIGSFYGGSALWMADMAQAWGLDTKIYSVDINKVWTARHKDVTFINGDGRNLGSIFSEEFLANLPRPLLVIEDADHSYQTTTAVLNFFHHRLRAGEYIIVEDVMTAIAEAGRALHEFLAAYPNDYLVDRQYCDFFGSNVTWCVNGFLKRINVAQS